MNKLHHTKSRKQMVYERVVFLLITSFVLGSICGALVMSGICACNADKPQSTTIIVEGNRYIVPDRTSGELV